jgi:VWFA-related protein
MFSRNRYRKIALEVVGAFALILALGLAAWGQQPGQSQPPQPETQAPPEAGGPNVDVGPMAIPKKKEEPPPERKPEVKNPPGMPEYSLRVDVPLVTVPVMVTTKDGQFIPGLKKENFRVYEDGVEQSVTNMSQSQDAPITAVLLVEYAESFWKMNYDALNASYSFAQMLKPNDWIAIVAYDISIHMLTDFTQNKGDIYNALSRIRIPASMEMNFWDALYDTIDRLQGVQGHKYLIIIGTGVDTFSKLHYDQALKKVKESKDITIFAVGTGRLVQERIGDIAGAYGGMRANIANMTYLQGQNAMNTIAKMTGGRFFFPRFESEMPEIFHEIGESVRNQYNLAYKPTNTKQDGTFRKVKVEVVGPNGQPLIVHNQKGKDVKYQVVARDGYTAKHTVE